MARMELLAVCALMVVLGGCAGAPPPTASISEAKGKESAFLETGIVPEIPPTKIEFGLAKCYLWNPRVNQDEAFYAIFVIDGKILVRRVSINDPLSYSMFIRAFQRDGMEIGSPFQGVTGWLAICKDHQSFDKGRVAFL
ncbi:MAG: hypothetical protein ABIO72_05765 [Patescibacteria group bacterium]